MSDHTQEPPQPSEQLQELKCASEASSPAELEQMFGALSNRIGRETQRERIAALPTHSRYALAGVLSLSIPLAIWLARKQILPPTFSPERQLWTLASYALCLGSLLSLTLRPLYKPPVATPILLLHLAGPFLLVFGFALWPADPSAVTPHAHHAAFGALPCLAMGVMLGATLLLLLYYLNRGQRFFPVLGAAAATVLGNAALQVFCSDPGLLHRVLGHAGVGLLFLLVIGLAHLLRRPATPT